MLLHIVRQWQLCWLQALLPSCTALRNPELCSSSPNTMCLCHIGVLYPVCRLLPAQHLCKGKTLQFCTLLTLLLQLR